MTLARNIASKAKPFAFRYQLRSLFILTAVCAVLSALYSNFGNASILILLLAAAALLAVTASESIDRLRRAPTQSSAIHLP